MKRALNILIILLLSTGAMAQNTAETDTLLRVLREELTADFAELQKQDVKPYFMSFRVQETWKADIIATFGYLASSQQKHTRTFTPQIRVGLPEMDNFKFNNQSGVGSSPLPLTDASAARYICTNINSGPYLFYSEKPFLRSDREVPVATPEKRNQPVLTFPLNS